MNRATPRHTHRFSLCALAALALAWALAPGSALARTSDGELSTRLQRLAQPALGNAPAAEQAEQLSLAAEGPGSLLRDGRRLLVDVRFGGGASAATEPLRAAGAEVVHIGSRLQTVTAAVKPGALHAVATVPGVESVNEILTPFTAATGCTGIVSEGDSQLGAAAARAAFGVDGSGVTVGILSDSFDQDTGAPTHAAQDVAGGDLPGPGNPCGYPTPVDQLESFIPFEPGELPGDEGRAMAQIVHDLAPASPLAFASAFNGELAFAAAIERLARPVALGGAGAHVVVDDVGYFEEPFFQEGPVAVAAGKVNAAGASYLSAAGNDNLIDSGGRDIASWEAPAYRTVSCPAALVPAAGMAPPGDCMDFDPGAGSDGAFGITVSKGATLTLDLQWAEPWNGVKTDLDAYLLDSTGKPLEVDDGKGGKELVGGYSNNVGTGPQHTGGSQRPVEVFQWENDTGSAQEVRLAVSRCALTCNPDATPGLTPRLKFALLQNGSGVTAIEYPESEEGDVVGPTLYGHAAAAGAIAVAAVPFNDSASAERYSSHGPVTNYFGPVSGKAAAAPITPVATPKPDIAATDCGATTFFAQFVKAEGVWRFCGTSAAAPHAAAVAALIRQANPGVGAAQVRTALTATARPVGTEGPEVVGAGLIDARAAVDSLALPPTVTITEAPQPLGRDRQPTIKFTANRPAAFSCQVDGVSQPCASPFRVPARLADGQHGFAVTATDLSGRVGGSGVVPFTVDTTAPRTFFAKHPPKLIRTKRRRVKAVFRFGSNDAGAVFICKVGRDLERYCPRRVVRRFTPGKHVVSVKARDAAGNVDATPAVFRLRVKRAE
jgi:hypothetical protein